MHRYTLVLLAFLGAACSDQKPETRSAAETKAAAPAASPDSGASGTSAARIQPTAVPLAQVPASLRQPGQLLEGWRWQDANGENLLVVFRSVTKSRPQPASTQPGADEVENMEELERTAQLTARQYVRNAAGAGYTELWHLQDAVAACALDMTLRLAPGSTTITDLDKDGRSETTLVYTLACRGDVSPATQKLIMRAGRAKYALRGTTVVQYDSVPAAQRQPRNPCCTDQLSSAQREAGNTEGYYDNEADFRSAPPAFLPFARRHWQQFSIEKTEEHEQL